MQEELRKYLESFLTEERFNGLHRVLQQRTRHLTIILENLYDTVNANAIMRTMDCFGIQDLHVIESVNQFKTDKKAKAGRGSLKWVDVHRYPENEKASENCIKNLKEKGYKIVATSPHATKTVSEIDYSQPIAFVFGNERDGISQTIIKNADELIKIPMYGFAESFNISVCAALTIQEARKKLESEKINFHLSETEKQTLYVKWLMKSVRHADKLAKKFLARH
jgi:tRNA (guanosine-2'-O-)-methyltransferase